MTLIQILLVAGLLAATILAWFILKRQVLVRLVFLALFAAGSCCVIWPHTMTVIGEHLGVGRGTDLLLYILVVFVCFASLCILAKFRQIEQKQTQLAREIAILNAKKLDQSAQKTVQNQVKDNIE